jgi:hypothetical protein
MRTLKTYPDCITPAPGSEFLFEGVKYRIKSKEFLGSGWYKIYLVYPKGKKFLKQRRRKAIIF